MSTLAGVILTSARGVRQDISELRGEVGTLRERMAHLEGLMEGLREAITLRGQSQLHDAHLCPVRVGHRVAFARALLTGRAADTEHSSPCSL